MTKKNQMQALIEQYDSGLLTIEELYNKLMLIEGASWIQGEPEGDSFNLVSNSEDGTVEIISDVDEIVASAEIRNEDETWLALQACVVVV